MNTGFLILKSLEMTVGKITVMTTISVPIDGQTKINTVLMMPMLELLLA